MKTSNRLLLGLCAFIGLVMISGMGIAKNNMIIGNVSNTSQSHKPDILQLVLLDSYESTTLILDESLVDSYKLDPNSSSISISADHHAARQIRVSDENNIKFSRVLEGEYSQRHNSSGLVEVIIGVKEKPALTIYLSHKSKLESTAAITSELKLHMEDRAYANFKYEGGKLTIDSTDDSVIDLSGSAARFILKAEDEAIVKAQKFSTEDLLVTMENDAQLSLLEADKISGEMEDKSIFSCVGACDFSKIRVSDSAVTRISSLD